MENINTKVLTALQSKSLDFDVVMREAYTLMNGVPTPNGKFNPVRVDADGKESLISGIGFSKDFTPVQNRDAFTVIGDLAELADIDLVNVGSWGNGAGGFFIHWQKEVKMPKGTMLDRLAGAMKTLGKREGKSMTPRQRVAAAQRWNSLASIADDRLAHMDALSEDIPEIMKDYNREAYAYDEMKLLRDQGNAYDNPFLSDNLDKYAEQSDFLDWCRYYGLEPNGRNLKTFRTKKIYDEAKAGDLGAGDAVIQVFNAAGGFFPETGYDALDGLQSRMDAGSIGALDAMDEAYLRGLRVARRRRGW